MSLREEVKVVADELKWVLAEIRKEKTEEDQRSAARRIVSGWTSRSIQVIKEDLADVGGMAAKALKRAFNEKIGFKIFKEV